MGDWADTWVTVDEAAASVLSLCGPVRPEVLVVLGSGWAEAGDHLGERVAETSTASLPGGAPAGVKGHSGILRVVRSPRGRGVLVLVGRLHGYEGHSPAAAVHGLRACVRAGCQTVVLTNAAGGIRADLEVGQPVLIADHLNLTGASPLTGPDAPGVTSRFVDLTDAYSRRLRMLAREIDPSLVEGVYAGLPGPNYETPAEIRMLRTLGADLVGMSTVHEAIAARHLGAELLGLSLVTNLAAGVGPGPLAHDEVLDAGRRAVGRVGDLLASLIDQA